MEAGPITPEMRERILRQVDPDNRKMFDWQLSHMVSWTTSSSSIAT